jgi:glycosyltransferase involved in cell wall biosynthesis
MSIPENNAGKTAVSIILPVYNGERFLEAAVNSVLSQTFSLWELLIVDDGSTDGSASICDRYAEKDNRIKVLHQPNGGVNSARAKGVDNATGEYLAFLDADDRFIPDALEYLLASCTSETDLLLAEERPDEIISRDNYLAELWTGKVAPALWGKLFRTAVYKRIDYALDRRLAMGEDLLLNSMYALEIDRIRLLPRRIYEVNHENETSVTKTFKHNWEYEKFYFSKVEELFLSKCSSMDSYDRIKLLVGKSWLNAMKYVMLDGGKIDYDDVEYKAVQDYFKDKSQALGPSEKLIVSVRSPFLYRLLLKGYLFFKRF